MSYNYSPILNIMLKIARKASRILVRDYGEICNLQSSQRSVENFALVAKSKVSELLVKDLSFARPDYSIMIEQQKINITNSSYSWQINPIDGLVNFTHGLPSFAVSISLTKKNKDNQIENVATVVDAPILNETFFAEKGTGSWLEKHGESTGSNFRLRVSARKELKDSIISLQDYNNFSLKDVDVRIEGTKDLSLAYLAAGRYDAIIREKNNIINCGSILLVTEAGGVVKELGSNQAQIVVANSNIIKLF
jgi:myo-inositol-1(or 4)-monophosphatase